MDAKDLQILRLMGVQPFSEWPRDEDHLRPGYIAKRLKIGPEAAKARIRKLERDGIILGYQIYPNYALLGFVASGYVFELQGPPSDKMLRDLALVDGVGSIERFLGPQVGCDIYGTSRAMVERRVKVVASLLGDAVALSFANYPTLPVARTLTRLDWRIIRHLRDDANKPLSKVATELNVSTRTVTRHFERLWKEGSIDTVVRLNTGTVPQVLFANVMLKFTGPSPGAQVKGFFREFDDSWAYCWTPPDRDVANLIVGLVFNSPGEIQRTLDRIRARPDIENADALISSHFTVNESWLTEAIEQQIQTAGTSAER